MRVNRSLEDVAGIGSAEGDKRFEDEAEQRRDQGSDGKRRQAKTLVPGVAVPTAMAGPRSETILEMPGGIHPHPEANAAVEGAKARVRPRDQA